MLGRIVGGFFGRFGGFGGFGVFGGFILNLVNCNPVLELKGLLAFRVFLVSCVE